MPGADDRLDIVVSYRERPFRAATASAALVLVGFVARDTVSGAMLAGIVALAVGVIAWSLIPRIAATRFVATAEGLTVVGEDAPLHRGQHFAADAIAGVFVRALARAERPEDRRLELVLVDRQGGRQSLLRGLENPATMAWIAAHLERALGFEVPPARR
ncbi:MAG: hypothetical protein R3B09_26390 [Nannocystaceae bacterium]